MTKPFSEFDLAEFYEELGDLRADNVTTITWEGGSRSIEEVEAILEDLDPNTLIVGADGVYSIVGVIYQPVW